MVLGGNGLLLPLPEMIFGSGFGKNLRLRSLPLSESFSSHRQTEYFSLVRAGIDSTRARPSHIFPLFSNTHRISQASSDRNCTSNMQDRSVAERGLLPSFHPSQPSAPRFRPRPPFLSFFLLFLSYPCFNICYCRSSRILHCTTLCLSRTSSYILVITSSQHWV